MDPSALAIGRRNLLKRAGVVAGVGVAASLVDFGGVAETLAAGRRPYLGGWLPDHASVVRAGLASPTYARVLGELEGRGIRATENGGVAYLDGPGGPLKRPAYVLLQQLTAGTGEHGVLQVYVTRDGETQSVAMLDSSQGRLHLGQRHTAHEGLSGLLTETRRESDALLIPTGRLGLPGGARVAPSVEALPAALRTPAADAQQMCDYVCAIWYGLGCGAFCAILCSPICALFCGGIVCAPLGTWVCGTVCSG